MSGLKVQLEPSRQVREKMESSNMLELFGMQEFKSDLPTHLAVIEKCNLECQTIMSETGRHLNTVTSSEIAKRVAPALLEHWGSLSSLLAPPLLLSQKSVFNKLVKLIDRARDFARYRLRGKDHLALSDVLFKLFDICSCRHDIYACQDKDSGKICMFEIEIVFIIIYTNGF